MKRFKEAFQKRRKGSFRAIVLANDCDASPNSASRKAQQISF
jgi:hypothetical protein